MKFDEIIQTYYEVINESKNGIYDLGGKVIYQNDDWLAEEQTSFDQHSKAYGKNTVWDTATSDGKRYFDEYNKRGKLIVIRKPKQRKPGAMLFIRNGKVEEALDRQARVFDTNKFFKEHPEIKDAILGE